MSKRVVTLDGTTLNTLDVHDVAHELAIVQVAEEAMMRVMLSLIHI